MTDFLPNAEQLELAESFSRPLEEMFPVARLHQPGADIAQWPQAAELGWFGVCLPEEAGGIGLSAVEDSLLFTRFGRHLLSPSILATTLAAHAAATAGDTDLAQSFLSGTAPVAMATLQDTALLMFDAEGAKYALALTAGGTRIFDLVRLEDRRRLDESQWSLPLDTATAPTPLLVVEEPKIQRHAALLIGAELAGIAGAARDMGVAYAQLRQQFGAPIGSFQAIKHHCVNMAMHALAARDMVAFAAVATAQNRPEHKFQIAAALNVSIRAALFCSRTNIQIHGGMGFSAECDAHLYLKRAHVLETLAGGLRGARAALRAEQSIFA